MDYIFPSLHSYKNIEFSYIINMTIRSLDLFQRDSYEDYACEYRIVLERIKNTSVHDQETLTRLLNKKINLEFNMRRLR